MQHQHPGTTHNVNGTYSPKLAIASLFGIRVLCKAGCTVTFNNDKCNIHFEDKLILRGYKDPSTDLWTLPITPKKVWTTPGTTTRSPHTEAMSHRFCISLPHVEAATLMALDLPYEATLPQPSPCISRAPHHPLGPCIGCTPHPTVIRETSTRHEDVATFTHSINTQVNVLKFTHQFLCNPKILTLLKAV